jgi:hypothetical protein
MRVLIDLILLNVASPIDDSCAFQHLDIGINRDVS